MNLTKLIIAAMTHSRFFFTAVHCATRSALFSRDLGVQSVVDVVRRGRLRWFGHLERRSVDDWV